MQFAAQAGTHAHIHRYSGIPLLLPIAAFRLLSNGRGPRAFSVLGALKSVSIRLTKRHALQRMCRTLPNPKRCSSSQSSRLSCPSHDGFWHFDRPSARVRRCTARRPSKQNFFAGGAGPHDGDGAFLLRFDGPKPASCSSSASGGVLGWLILFQASVAFTVLPARHAFVKRPLRLLLDEWRSPIRKVSGRHDSPRTAFRNSKRKLDRI